MVTKILLCIAYVTIITSPFIHAQIDQITKTYTFEKLWHVQIEGKKSDSTISNTINSIISLDDISAKKIKTRLTVIISKSFYKQNEAEIFNVLKAIAGTCHFMQSKNENINPETTRFNVTIFICDETIFLDEKKSHNEIKNLLESIKKINEKNTFIYHSIIIAGECVAPIWSFCKTISEPMDNISFLANSVILLNPMVDQEMHDKENEQFRILAQNRVYNLYSKPEYKVSTFLNWAWGSNNKRKMKPVIGRNKNTLIYKNLVQNILISLYNNETYDLLNWQTKEVQTAIKLIPFFIRDADALFKIWPDIEVNISTDPINAWCLKTRNDFEIGDNEKILFNNNEWSLEAFSQDRFEFVDLFKKEKKIIYDSAHIE